MRVCMCVCVCERGCGMGNLSGCEYTVVGGDGGVCVCVMMWW